MRRLLLVCLALLSGCAHEAAAPKAEPAAAPEAKAPPSVATQPLPAAPFRLPDSVKPLSYALELTIDPKADQFSGTERIEVAIAPGTKIIWLHAEELNVTKAELELNDERSALSITRAAPNLIALRTTFPFHADRAALVLEWSAPFNDKSAQGLFRKKLDTGAYALTQFEAIDARRAFPCFDEPGFKTPFQVTLVVPEDQRAFSNMPEGGREPAPNLPGFVRVRFDKSPPLPTYLVAFAVGPFEVVDAGTAGRNKTPLRIIVTKGNKAGAAYAAKEVGPILDALEKYFGQPYPYPKLDAIEIPVTGAFFGAMENVGLITYSGSLLVAPPDHDSLQRQRRFSDVAAHEMAHQWFGDLVTPAWWDDIWLNESFASWMSGKMVAAIHPDWRFETDRVFALGEAIAADSVMSARQIRQPVTDEGDIQNAFDGITYQKGASVLAMFEHQVGEDRFRDGVRAHLQAHANGNATAEDFLGALSKASGTDVSGAFKTFLEQPGVPEVSFELSCDKGKPPALKLAQQRYVPLGTKSPKPQTWRVPVCVRFEGGRACTELADAQGTLELGAAKRCPAWVVPNEGAYGYYVARLSPALLGSLRAAKKDPLTTAEKMRLSSDAFSLLRNGNLPANDALELIASTSVNADRQVVEFAATELGDVPHSFLPEELVPAYARWIDAKFSARAKKLGLAAKKGESEEDRLLRPTLISLTGLTGEDADVRKAVRQQVQAWLGGKAQLDPDLFATFVTIAAKDGDAAFHDALRKKLVTLEARRERNAVVAALGWAKDAATLEQNLRFLLLGDAVDPNEGIFVLFAATHIPWAREATYDFMTAHYDEVLGRLSPQTAIYMPFLASGFCDDVHKAAAKAFFEPKVEKVPGLDRTLAQSLEQVQQCIDIRAAQKANLAKLMGAAK